MEARGVKPKLNTSRISGKITGCMGVEYRPQSRDSWIMSLKIHDRQQNSTESNVGYSANDTTGNEEMSVLNIKLKRVTL